MNVPSFSVFRRFAAAAGIGMALAAGAPAAAQMAGAAGLADLGRHDYLHRDIVLISQGLGLGESQRLIVDSLYEDYRERFDAGWEAVQERLDSIRDDVSGMDRNNVSKIMDVVMAPFEDWRAEKQRLKERFENDVRTILNPQQAERWPRFMEQMTREKTLHRGELTGETLNLFHVVNDLRLTERALLDIEAVMEQYSKELDAVLRARNQLLDREQVEFIRSLRAHGQPPSNQNAQAIVNSRVAVRDMNLRYVDVIAERLPSDKGETFRQRAMEAANPRVFRPLPAMRAFDRALELEGLEEDTLAAIRDLRETFALELASTNPSLHRMMLEFEPRQALNRAKIWEARQAGEHVDRIEDPTRDHFARRDEQARSYLSQLRPLLSAEEYASLPGVRERVAGATRGGERRRLEERGVITRDGDSRQPRGAGRDRDVPGRSGAGDARESRDGGGRSGRGR